jgi:pimeloyl-ACP methyl ester carboxylesterase
MRLKNLISFDGTRISYAINRPLKGSGKFIVFLHGDGSNYTVYKPFFRRYAKRNWVALNIRNHGGSGRGSISIENMVEDLRLIVRRERVKKCILVGNCLGASIAVGFTKKYPGMVKSLVLITPLSSDSVRMPWLFSIVSSYILLFIRPFGRKNSQLRLSDYHKYRKRPFWYRPTLDIRGTSFTNYFSVIKILVGSRFELAGIEKRILIVLCKKDIFIRKSAVYSMAEQNDKIMVKIINSGHHPLTQNARELVKASRQMLEHA